MKMYESVLTRVRQIEYKNGITYAKPDGGLYKTSSVLYIIISVWNLLLGLVYSIGLIGLHSGKPTMEEAVPHITVGIASCALIVIGFALNRFKLYAAGGILTIPSILGLVWLFGSVSVDEFGFLGFSTRFYFLNLIPLAVMLVLALIITILPLRAKHKTEKLYKKVVEELFERFGDNHQLSDVEWEDFLKNYDHLAYKKLFNAGENTEKNEG